MIGQLLKKEEGVTFDVLAQKEGQEEDKERPNHVLIPEVVREPKMHYYQVPRLGSYLAIKLEYNSCLFEESFDAALSDYAKVRNAMAE